MKHQLSRFAASALFLSIAACGPFGTDSQDDVASAIAENRWRDAANMLAKESAAQPADEALARKHVEQLLLLGEGDAAKSAIDAFAAAAPDKAQQKVWVYLRAEADVRRGKPRLALGALKDDTAPEAERIKAIAMLMQGKYGEAEELLQSAYAQDSEDERITTDLALLLIGNARLDEARPLVNSLQKNGSNTLGALMVRGNFLAAENKPEEALAFFDKAAGLYPDSRTPKVAQLHALAESGQFDVAEKLASELRQSGLNTSEVITLQAGIFASRDDWKKVREILQASEQIVRDNPAAQLLYGMALRKDGQAVTAATLMERALLRNPDYMPLRYNLAQNYLEDGNIAEARRVLMPVRESEDLPPNMQQIVARVFRAETQTGS